MDRQTIDTKLHDEQFFNQINCYTIDMQPIMNNKELSLAFDMDGAVVVERYAEDGSRKYDKIEHPALSEIYHLHCLRMMK